MITLREALWALKEALPNKALWAEHNCTLTPDGPKTNFPVRLAGICMNVEQYLRLHKVGGLRRKEIMTDLDFLMMNYCGTNLESGPWPYPVGGAREFYHELENGAIWENPKRIELLDWLVEHCNESH